MNTLRELHKLERQLTIVIGSFAILGVYLIGVSVFGYFLFELPGRGIDPSYETQLLLRHLVTVNMFVFLPVVGILSVLSAVFLRNYRRHRNRLIGIATC